ncbi:MAG: hypothetical protein FJX60_12330 [Alphaproteobacteria bacterium]|nr:hypothetical protein [Alphaproteobacteria bacterium]
MRFLLLLLSALTLSFSAYADTYTSFTWVSYTQRHTTGTAVITQAANVWNASGGNLSFSATGVGSYIEDFMQSNETFAVEGIRVEFDMTGTVGTSLGYVGPFVLLTADSGKGWNYRQPIGAQTWYRWEYQGTAGAVGRRGRIGNQDAGRVSFSGLNGGAAAHHVFTVQRGVFTWTVNGTTVSSGDMGAAPYSNMRLIVGARLYDSGRVQSASITNLKVTTAAPAYTGPANVSVSGTIANSSGTAEAVTCSGNMQHKNASATGTVTITGAVGCSGANNLYINVNGTYNATTRTFSGTYTDASGGSSEAITFTATGTDLQWQGRMTGRTSTSSGSRAYDLTVSFALPADAYRASADLSDLRFTGTINQTQSITIPLNIPQINVNESIPMNIRVSGSWEVQVVPGTGGAWTLSGHASGTFSGDRTVTATGSVVVGGQTIAVPISFDIAGSFGGTLFGSSAGNNLKFTGNWTSTSGDQSFGGSVNLTLPIDTSSGRIPNLSSAFSGAMSPTIPNFTAPSVPISFTGSAPLVITTR